MQTSTWLLLVGAAVVGLASPSYAECANTQIFLTENQTAPNIVRILECTWRGDDADGQPTTAESSGNPIIFGGWSNAQCGTNGLGWHQKGAPAAQVRASHSKAAAE